MKTLVFYSSGSNINANSVRVRTGETQACQNIKGKGVMKRTLPPYGLLRYHRYPNLNDVNNIVHSMM